MASEIRVNQIQNRSGLSTVTFSDTGLSVSGILTATTFSGNLTGNVTGAVNSSGIATFSNGVIVSAGTTSAPSISPSGDSNTGIFFPSPDTVAIAEGGVEVLRVDSNGRLGIGTNNPASTLDVGGEITIRRTAPGGEEGGQVNFARASDNAVAWNIDAFGSTSTPSLRFIDAIAAASRANIDSSGNFTVSSGNIVIGTSGRGIDFSATANSSGTMTSELLSDYEEGTWDCRPTTSTSSIVLPSGITSLTYNGTYVKIGSLVVLTGYFETSQISSSTSVVYLLLPFAVNGTVNMWSSTACETNRFSFPSGVTYVTNRPESGNSYASFKGCGSGIPRVDLQANNIFASSGMYWIGMMVYRTA